MLLTGKRMVFAAEFQAGGTGQGLEPGFRELGWAVQEVDVRQFFPRLPSRAWRAAMKPLQPQFRAAYNQAILETAARDKPQVFLTVKGSLIASATLEALRARGIKIANYYPDRDFDRTDLDNASLDGYDLFVTTKSYQVGYLETRLGAHRVAFVQHGYCDLVHRPLQVPVEPVADVLYVGNYSAEKERWLGALTRLLPDVDLRVVGFAWDRATDTILRPRILGHGYHGDNYARALQLARINIALHGDRHEPDGWQDLVSTRTFEIPACKGFMLHIDNAEIRTLFEPGTEIGVFATPEDLARCVRRYLAEPELRRSMIERAYARAVPAYGYAARARSIEALISERLGAPVE
jgi:glycosyltransferase involved in cell wall biosynthesis